MSVGPSQSSRLSLRLHGTEVTFVDPPPEIVEFGDARDVRESLRAGQFYEQELLEYIRSLDLRGVYVDVGGFIGTHALYFAMLCPAEHVFTFEPRPVPRDELERNVAANHQQARITVRPFGLADRGRTVEVEIEHESATFECRAMDDVVDRPVALIKIDVSGMELDVLRGASRILSQHRPAIFSEASSREQRQQISDYLGGFGYVRTGRMFGVSPIYEFVVPSASAR
jgi:FkbM family methyltransferase